jgi:hypothetical protein
MFPAREHCSLAITYKPANQLLLDKPVLKNEKARYLSGRFLIAHFKWLFLPYASCHS